VRKLQLLRPVVVQVTVSSRRFQSVRRVVAQVAVIVTTLSRLASSRISKKLKFQLLLVALTVAAAVVVIVGVLETRTEKRRVEAVLLIGPKAALIKWEIVRKITALSRHLENQAPLENNFLMYICHHEVST
jgi:hypothetical protein